MNDGICRIPWVQQWYDRAGAGGTVSPSELKELKALMEERGVPQDRQVCADETPWVMIPGANTYYPKSLDVRPVQVSHGGLFLRVAREVVEQRPPITLTWAQLATLKRRSFHVQKLRCGAGEFVHSLQGKSGGKSIEITVTYVPPSLGTCGEQKPVVTTLRIGGREAPLKPEALATLHKFLSPAQAALSQHYSVLPPLVNKSSIPQYGEPDARIIQQIDDVEDPNNPPPNSPWISKEGYETAQASRVSAQLIQAKLEDWKWLHAGLLSTDTVAAITAVREAALKFLEQNPQVPGLPKAKDIPSVSQLCAAAFERILADTSYGDPTVEMLQSLQLLAPAADIPVTTWQPRVVRWVTAHAQNLFRSDHEDNWTRAVNYINNIAAVVGKTAVRNEMDSLLKMIQDKINENREKLVAEPYLRDLYQDRIDVLAKILGKLTFD